jgi:hypothetical protein
MRKRGRAGEVRLGYIPKHKHASCCSEQKEISLPGDGRIDVETSPLIDRDSALHQKCSRNK